MKTLLRTTFLTAALMATALATAGIATTSPTVSCYTVCYSDTGDLDDEITVQWGTTQATCCGGSIAPCPTGYHKGWSYYRTTGLSGGSLLICPGYLG